MFCRQLGYDHGETYTFGSTNYLPQLPIVYGYRVCSGTERNLMNCADTSGKKVTGFNDDGTAIFTNDGYTIPDQDCMHGCLGTDGILGTEDDSIYPVHRTEDHPQGWGCDHAVDQGAICHSADEVGSVKVPTCGSGGEGPTELSGWAVHNSQRNDQAVVFACIHYCKEQSPFAA